jgi:hypothetical protein
MMRIEYQAAGAFISWGEESAVRCLLKGIGLRGTMLSVVVVVAITAASAQAANGNVTCTTEIDNTTISGNLTVPAGAACILHADRVYGNVSVAVGASLGLHAGTTVYGNVSVAVGASLSVSSSDVGGNVSVAEGASINAIDPATHFDRNLSTEGANMVNLTFITVGGNSSFDATTGSLSVSSTDNGGNVSITNTSPDVVVYADNHVAGDLTCYGNTGGVTNDGLPNTVLGQEYGQCAGL